MPIARAPDMPASQGRGRLIAQPHEHSSASSEGPRASQRGDPALGHLVPRAALNPGEASSPHLSSNLANSRPGDRPVFAT